jgi:excisionase family DNA binding protein
VTTDSPGGLVRVREAADALNCSRQYIHTLIREGRLEHVDVGRNVKRQLRIPSDSLARFLVERNSR